MWRRPRAQFEKDFYKEHPNVTARSLDEVNEFYRHHGIRVQGSGVPKPVTSFVEANFPSYLYKEIVDVGFKEPTPIQCQGWPMALGGKDMVGIAETGSGKTLAYALPAIVHINAQPYLKPVRTQAWRQPGRGPRGGGGTRLSGLTASCCPWNGSWRPACTCSRV